MVKSAIAKDDYLIKTFGMYSSHKYSGARLKEIGTIFSVGESAV